MFRKSCLLMALGMVVLSFRVFFISICSGAVYLAFSIGNEAQGLGCVCGGDMLAPESLHPSAGPGVGVPTHMEVSH